MSNHDQGNHNQPSVTLYQRWGRSAQTLEKFTQDYLNQQPEAESYRFWAEPRPGRNQVTQKFERVQDYPFLGRRFNPTHPVEEIRLFFATKMLHVLADEAGGCRWFECSEAPPAADHLGPEISEDQFDCHDHAIYTLQDRARFFGKPNQATSAVAVDGDRVTIREYRYPGTGKTFTWRIMPKNAGGDQS